MSGRRRWARCFGLVLLLPGAGLAQARPELLPRGAVVELRFPDARDVALVRANGDTVIARGLHAVMGRVREERGDTLVLTSLFGRRPGDGQFHALGKRATARVARTDVGRVMVVSRHPRTVHVGALVVVGVLLLGVMAVMSGPAGGT